MRVWRKLHASILDSSDIASLSDAAVLLLTFLIVAQDDTGYYPWDATKIKRLTVTRNWGTEKIQGLATELCSAGIAQFEEGGILLINGMRFNGKPRKDVDDDIYARNATIQTETQHVNTTSTPRQHDVDSTLHQSRVERVERVEKREGGAEAPFVLPEWLNKSLWESFLTMRKKAKAMPTRHAQTLLIAALGKLKEEGNSPDAVLEQSIMNGWKGLFAVKNGVPSGQGRLPKTEEKTIYRSTPDADGHYQPGVIPKTMLVDPRIKRGL